MKFTPVLKSWPSPPWPETCHEKSSRNWNFLWLVVCGALPVWPTATPFGKPSFGRSLFATMLLRKVAYWKMNSFSLFDPRIQLWLRLIELNVFSLMAQLFGGDCGDTP